MDAPRPSGPNCYQCRHFAVSWDPAAPYACRLMGFKSRALPAIEVLRVDGVRCRGFAAKPPAALSPPAPSAPAEASRSAATALSGIRRLV